MSCWTSVLEQVYFGGSNFSYNDDDSGRWTMADKSQESVVARPLYEIFHRSDTKKRMNATVWAWVTGPQVEVTRTTNKKT